MVNSVTGSGEPQGSGTVSGGDGFDVAVATANPNSQTKSDCVMSRNEAEIESDSHDLA